ncbi:Periplasmic protein involved in polysaccharide export [Synechococcus sp. RCC307]|nr:Periplasmic protein involved in polysaccharide export [Synechococcus sp. RCC307]
MLSRAVAAAMLSLSAVQPVLSQEITPTSQVINLAPKAYTGDSYILGPGDAVVVELLDVPEYSGVFSIGPDGSLYLPRLRALQVEGLTVEELQAFLTQQFSMYVQEPQVYVSPAAFRPIRVYVGGEVRRPGYYYLTGLQAAVSTGSAPTTDVSTIAGMSSPGFQQGGGLSQLATNPNASIRGTELATGIVMPTVFDAMRNAGGVTPYSKLEDVVVVRRRPLGTGGGKMRTSLNFLSVITEGNESQNIRLFDGDTVIVSRSEEELRDQIIKAGQTNLSPDFLEVFVSGRVRQPGTKVLPQGATLEQALASAGGTKILRGTVEFVRFNRDGTTDKRQIFGVGSQPGGSYENPVLMEGDLIRVNNSPLSATTEILGEITAPAVGVLAIYDLVDRYQK